MKITFWGAAGEVTGSCTLIETRRARVMVDCGIHQGHHRADARNRRPPWKASLALDAVVLSHAHLDHSGRLPLLNRLPGSWSIHATPATIALTEILLQDSARIQEHDAASENRRRLRAGRKAVSPLYGVKDAAETLGRFTAIHYQTPAVIAPGVSIRFVDAGHILGSASIEMRVEDQGRAWTIVFSADVGVDGSPLLNDPATFEHADAVLLESTYGDRDHRPIESTLDEFAAILADACQARQKVLIPSFAVGRTQNLIHHIAQLRRAGRIGEVPVYIDSPMASAATKLYKDHADILDDQGQDDARRKRLLTFPGLRATTSAEESRALNDFSGPAVIIAGSGMCTGGRILHHLRHNLWKTGVHVVFVGYQGAGTLGAQLVSRAPSVRIFGETVAVRARIHTLGGFSAHAGQSALLKWISPLAGRPGSARPRVFLTHGEDGPRAALAGRLASDLGLDPVLPGRGDSYTF
ncbi:MAG: MBL fold metallo-hydrolase [Phycisphaeraceae bacterium]|nr:MBL fold metallo-hydrolase [Phycisphaerae bacterium]MBX3392952.1 MBL fold metallo-hydrolase [Phycisphaeraceae bacterium]